MTYQLTYKVQWRQVIFCHGSPWQDKPGPRLEVIAWGPVAMDIEGFVQVCQRRIESYSLLPVIHSIAATT